jgi:hypothetical protein
LRLLLVPVDRKDQNVLMPGRSGTMLTGFYSSRDQVRSVFGQLLNASSRGSWWRWRGNNLGRWRVDMAEFGMTRVRIGLFQHALAHPEANGERFESIEAKLDELRSYLYANRESVM